MTALIREFLRNCPHVDLVVIGELMFFTIFVVALAWVFRSGSKAFYDQLAKLPLEDGARHDGK